MAPIIYESASVPLSLDESMSVPQLMIRYNPDNVDPDKVIHTDTIKGKDITYAGLREQAARCAYGLRHSISVQVQDTILCLIPNSTDFVLLAHSVWWAGAVFSSMNPVSTSKDIAHAINIVQPKFMVVYPAYLESVKAAIRTAGQSPTVMTIIDRAGDLPLFPDDVVSTSSLPPFNPADHGLTGRTARANINFSSGTTGAIKAVALSHYNLIANTVAARATLPATCNSSMREVFFPPYCHVYGLVVSLLQNAWLGSFTCAMHQFELVQFCQLMEKYKANWAHLVPPIAVALANQDVVAKYDLSRLERMVVAAAPVKKDLQQRLKQRFGQKCRIIQGYGMTECPTVSHQLDGDEDFALGSVGRPVSGTDVRLVNPISGEDVGEPGQEGELWVRAPQVMMGYVNNEKANKETFSEDRQWLRTGDIMVRDERGSLWVTDRMKEMIKYKGLQVPPSELEGVLLGHKDVIDAAVCSVYDDEQATELPVAYVALREPLAELDGTKKQHVLDGIRTWVDGQVAGYKKLRGGVFHLQQLPKTASGKILRKDLPVAKLNRRQAKM